jgi:NAD(P)-dependent dehydrogenase (short-subunit alcohol dehydrogenase family)
MASIDKYPYVMLISGANRGLGLEFVKQAALGTPADVKPLFGYKTVDGVATTDLEIPTFIPKDAIVLAACRNPESATELKAVADASEGRVRLVKLTVDSAADISALVAHIDAEYGRLDLLINNAGASEKRESASVGTIVEGDFSTVFTINAFAPILLTNALMPALKRTLAAAAKTGGFEPLAAKTHWKPDPTSDCYMSKDDIIAFSREATSATESVPEPLTAEASAAIAHTPVRVVYISSKMSSITALANPGKPIYCASKSALNMLVRCLALEVPGIAFAVLHPGWVATDMGGKSAPLQAPASIAGMIEVIKRMRADKYPVGVQAFDGRVWPF